MKRKEDQRAGRGGFTLLELLVASVVLLLVMVVLLQLTGGVGQIWKDSEGKISAFQNARAAFALISRTLSRSTLNTYSDYVDAAGNYRNANNPGSFTPAKFARASELHFLSGPASEIVVGAQAAQNPGGAIFFQAPSGESDDSGIKKLGHTLNSIGFYIHYGQTDDSLLPDWLKPLMGNANRFRLIQVVEPAEDLGIYTSTAGGSYNLDWLQSFRLPASSSQPRMRVLAENVPLLIFRPRLAPKDEEAAASRLGASYSPASRGSILCPNYHYDSRAWQPGYPTGQRVGAASPAAPRAEIMRNQIPPIVDVAMVAVDRQSLSRFDQTGSTPPAPLRIPATLFRDSSRLEQDLATYGQQLSEAGIRYRIFRTSVEIQGAKWSTN